MKKIGLIIAMEEEYAPFIARLGKEISTETLAGVKFTTYENENGQVILAHCGVGEVGAAAGTALLIGHYKVCHVFNFGLVGALKGDYSRKSVVAVESVVHYDTDLTAFGYLPAQEQGLSSPFIYSDKESLKISTDNGFAPVRLASGDKFIADNKYKQYLIDSFDADICDMEGAAIGITCARAGVPFSMLKTVSDDAGDEAKDKFENSKNEGVAHCVDAVLSLMAKK